MTRDDYNLWGKISTARRGTKLTQAKLTPEKVRAIRANVRGRTLKQLADDFGVHHRTIQKVRYGDSWGHVV